MDDDTEDKGPSLQEQVLDAVGLAPDSAGEDDAQADVAAGTVDAGAPAKGGAPDAGAPADAVVAEKKEPPKPGEPDIYAPLPEHNPRRTHERFAKLIEGHKQLDAKLKEYEPIVQKAQELEAKLREHEEGWNTFRAMGFNSEDSVRDLEQFSQYRQALGSRNWDAAAAIIQKQAQQLALLSGRKIDVDPLREHADIAQRVQAGAIDEGAALELARHRYAQQIREQQERQYAASQQQHNEQVQQIRQAASAVDGVVRVLMRDPDYAKVEPELLKQVGAIKQNYPAHMWAQEVKRAYDTEARILRLAAQQQQVSVTPLRGNGQAGGRPAPKSMAEAALQELGLA